MRHISVALTQAAVLAQTKTVTRRVGWRNVKEGEWLQPIEKAQGLKKGEKVRRVGVPILVLSARLERLSRLVDEPDYGEDEMVLEGFPDWTAQQFVDMFAAHNAIKPREYVTRIEFRYATEREQRRLS